MRRARPGFGCAGFGPLLAVAIGASLCACGGEEAPRVPEAKAAVPEGRSDGSKAKTRAPESAAPAPDDRFAASNILVAYAGAKKAAASVTRTKEEARALADQLYARIAAGEEFGAVADEYADGPERGHGGRLGVFVAAKMLPAIARTVAGLAEGAVAKPVESEMGFHILRRDKIEELYIAEIVVAFKGAQGAPEEVSRSRDEASARAGEALAAARAKGAVFSDVVAKYSDHPTKGRGGVLGRVFRGLFPPELDALAFSLKPGEIGGPLEMPNGFTILRRLPEANVRHVLVAYAGAARAPKEVTRGREAAAALAAEALEKLERGDDFAGVAKAYSDCLSKERGGELGVVAEGTMTPRFEQSVFGLAPGARSGVVETEFGFHVMERLR
jgi:parvulin-like peptidyl-prolyl isomerase